MFIITILYFYCFQNALSADNQIFKVLNLRGTVEVSRKGIIDDLKIGSNLYKNDIIEIKNGSYLSIVHKTSRTLEIKKTGIFNVNDLETEVLAKANNTSNKIVEFVSNNVLNKQNENIRSKMKHGGAVERSLKGNKRTAFKFVFPGNSYLLDTNFTIAWNSFGDSAQYNVVFYDIDDNVINLIESKDTVVHISYDFSKDAITNFVEYNIQVIRKDSSEFISESYILNLLTKNEINEINGVINNTIIENSADYLILAKYLDFNHLKVAALEFLTKYLNSADLKDIECDIINHYYMESRIE